MISKKVNKAGLILLILVTTTIFFSCNTTKVETTKVEKTQPVFVSADLNDINVAYWNKFNDTFMSNKDDPELLEILSQWKNDAPLADYYMCSFIYYFGQSVISEDNTHLNFPENTPWIQEGDISRYPQTTVNETILNKGIAYLVEGINNFQNRFDLWNQLITVLAAFFYHDDLTDVLLKFMNTIQVMKNDNIVWFVKKNTPISSLPNYTDNDTLFYNVITQNASVIVGRYRFKGAYSNYEKICRKLIELYPEDSAAYFELGYSLPDQTEALKYYDKAYELDNTNKNAIIYAAATSYYLNDVEKLEKYKTIVYNSGDEELIKTYEANIAAFNNN